MQLQEISDRLEITDLLARYALAVDSGRWNLLDTIFTAEAVIDYSSTGGAKGQLPEIKAWLSEVLPTWPARQHLLGPAVIAFDSGEAGVSVSFSDTLTSTRDLVSADTPGTLTGGGWYHHRLTRTPDGWRSRDLVVEQIWRTYR